MRIAWILLAFPIAALADVAPHSQRIDPARMVELSGIAARTAVWLPAPNGRYMAFRTGREVTILDIQTGKDLGALKGHADTGVHDGGWSGNGKFLATAGNGQAVKVWDVAEMKEIASLTPHAGYS